MTRDQWRRHIATFRRDHIVGIRADELRELLRQDDNTDLREALRQISMHADVMIGNGPGATDAYYRLSGRVANGLPTTFAQLRQHARDIRAIVQSALTPEIDKVEE